MIRRKLCVTIIAFATLFAMPLVTPSAHAAGAGQTAADFLQIGVGSRSAGLGGAYTALAENATAAYWNPAGLARLSRSEVSVSHFAWYQDITIEQAQAAFAIGDRGGLALSAIFLNYGTIDNVDANGVVRGELSASDWSAGLSFGYQLTDLFSLGVTGKYISQTLDTYSAGTLAADFGLRADWPRFSAAIAVVNVGGSMTFDAVQEDLPAAARLGLAFRPFGSGVVAAVEYEERFYGPAFLRQGVEVEFEDRYFLRAGYDYGVGADNTGSASGMSFGAGLKISGARLDYAYTASDEFTNDNLHRFSLTLGFGSIR